MREETELCFEDETFENSELQMTLSCHSQGYTFFGG